MSRADLRFLKSLDGGVSVSGERKVPLETRCSLTGVDLEYAYVDGALFWNSGAISLMSRPKWLGLLDRPLEAFSSSLVGGVGILFADGASLSESEVTTYFCSCGLEIPGTSCIIGSWSMSPFDGASSSPLSLGGCFVHASRARDVASLSTMGAGGHDRRFWTNERALLRALAGSWERCEGYEYRSSYENRSERRLSMVLVIVCSSVWQSIGTAYGTVVGLRYASSLTRVRGTESYWPYCSYCS